MSYTDILTRLDTEARKLKKHRAQLRVRTLVFKRYADSITRKPERMTGELSEYWLSMLEHCKTFKDEYVLIIERTDALILAIENVRHLLAENGSTSDSFEMGMEILHELENNVVIDKNSLDGINERVAIIRDMDDALRKAERELYGEEDDTM